MEPMDQWLDRVLASLQGEGLDPVTIVLDQSHFEALQKISEPTLRTSTDGTVRFRGTPVYRARDREGSSVVGRAVSGKTTRVPLPEARSMPTLGSAGESDPQGAPPSDE